MLTCCTKPASQHGFFARPRLASLFDHGMSSRFSDSEPTGPQRLHFNVDNLFVIGSPLGCFLLLSECRLESYRSLPVYFDDTVQVGKTMSGEASMLRETKEALSINIPGQDLSGSIDPDMFDTSINLAPRVSSLPLVSPAAGEQPIGSMRPACRSIFNLFYPVGIEVWKISFVFDSY